MSLRARKYKITYLNLRICSARETFRKSTKLIMNSQVIYLLIRKDDTVAIKIIQLNSLKSKKLEQLLFQQIDVLKKLNHPNILRCFQVFTSNRNCYIITQLCNQGDLESKLRLNHVFTQQKAVPLIKDIFYGLAYLAQKNVIHRDLKVANIFLHNGKAKIADFGFAKFTKNKFKDINIGSPIYMSPEGLIQNVYGPKTDIWAFGIMMYQLLHGETPFSHCKTQQQLKYSMSVPIGWSQLKSQLSSQIKEVILKCLQIKQQKRATASQLKKLSFFRNMFEQSKQQYTEYQKIQINHTKQMEEKSKSKFDWRDLDPFKKQNPSSRLKQQGKTTVNKSNGISSSKDYSNPTNMSYTQTSKNQMNQSQNDLVAGRLSQISRERQLNKYVKQFKKDYSIQKDKFSRIQIANSFQKNKKVENGQQKYKGETKQKDKIIVGQVNFKICVNILHYCRLIYKYITTISGINNSELFQQNQKNVFVRWLAIVMKAVNQKIQGKEVIYQGQNASVRQQKLKQVSKQYQKKYSKQLGVNIQKINPMDSTIANYDYMCNYFYSIVQQMDNYLSRSADKSKIDKNGFIIGHYIIMIFQSTKKLKKCFDEKNFKFFESYKDVQTFLNLKKQQMDLPSYQWYKKKYIQK